MTDTLRTIAENLEASTGFSSSANLTEEGYWRRIALALESAAGVSTVANTNEEGYAFRAALALEVLEGTSGAEETRTLPGYLKRIADALESKTGVGVGNIGERIRVASQGWTPVPPTEVPANLPVLTLATAATTYPPEFDVGLDDTHVVGDTIVLTQYSDVRGTTVVGTFENTIDSTEATNKQGTFTGLASITSGTYYYDAHIRQADGDVSTKSALLIHGEAADSTPAAFTFTDGPTDATTSTVYESNTVTLSGFNQPVPISVSGGEYALNGGTYTTAEGTAYPGDTAKVRHTTSASNSTPTDTTLTAGGVSDTFSTTTVAAPVSLPASGMVLRLDADDTSTLFQDTAGTTAIADGQPVGYWGDKSANLFHLSANANDTTRPTYRAGAGLPYVEFDGVNDILRRLAELGMYNGGVCTVAVALRSGAPAANQTLLGEGRGSVSNNPLYSPLQSVTTNNTTKVYIRNDAGTVTAPTPPTTETLTQTDKVAIVVDRGADVIGYSDGVAGTLRAYTRSGTLTLDRFGLGGFQRGTPSNFFPGRIYALAVWNRELTSAEISQVNSYMASKQGRLL